MDFAKLNASFESDRDTGKDGSFLDKNFVEEEKVALQDWVELGNREASKEREMEMTMEA